MLVLLITTSWCWVLFAWFGLFSVGLFFFLFGLGFFLYSFGFFGIFFVVLRWLVGLGWVGFGFFSQYNSWEMRVLQKKGNL